MEVVRSPHWHDVRYLDFCIVRLCISGQPDEPEIVFDQVRSREYRMCTSSLPYSADDGVGLRDMGEAYEKRRMARWVPQAQDQQQASVSPSVTQEPSRVGFKF